MLNVIFHVVKNSFNLFYLILRETAVNYLVIDSDIR